MHIHSTLRSEKELKKKRHRNRNNPCPNKDIRGCVACGTCRQVGRCVFDDMVNEVAPKFVECDGIILKYFSILCIS